MSGASISPELKTVSVQYIQNNAPKVLPTLSQTITDALREKCRYNTRLQMVNENGDASFEGEITDYDVSPTSIQAGDVAAQNRLTIKVRIKFTNIAEPKFDFENTFTRYIDFPGSQTVTDFENDTEKLKEIIDLIVDDIFNKAFVNW